MYEHEFHPLKGRAAHEVAVGPVHAGVIEPGHFRFQCVGEDVHYLEIALGYQHRGAEKLIVEAKSDARRLAIAETVAGDTSVAAGIASAAALGIGNPYGECSRLLLELERIANHVGDLGALAGDVAYLPTASFCGRIRGEYLNMTAQLTGSRFGRCLAHAPGLTLAPLATRIQELAPWFKRTKHECFHALDLLFSESSAIERFEGTGVVPKELAHELGLVGVALKASEQYGGDVLGRAKVRYDELVESHRIVERILANPELAEQELREPVVNVSEARDMRGFIRVAIVNAWRGPLVHAATFSDDRRLVAYRITDPSFYNWRGLSAALRHEQISNFPICNKSFNLSYCGVDK